MSKEGIVNIKGKEYRTVALRVNEFHHDGEGERLTEEGARIITELVHRDEVCVVMKASILDNQNNVLATGHGEEFRAAGMINKTSALENAETSAIGRALAAHGFGGTEFASANEVQGAIQQQQKALPEHVAAINAYLEQGIITPDQLVQRFGHSDPARLLLVEANRIINGVAARKPLMAEIEAMHPQTEGN
jgi:hypothetical protein